MNEENEGTPPPPPAPPPAEVERRADAERHWAGYPGQPEAESYGIVDRGRYGLLLSLLLLAFLLTAIAVMVHGYK